MRRHENLVGVRLGAIWTVEEAIHQVSAVDFPDPVRIEDERRHDATAPSLDGGMMRTLVAVEHLSLDGVMQAPGRPDEDLRGGFEHGGWAAPRSDAVIAQAMAGGMANAGAMLFGRRTYLDFFEVWPKRTNNPYTHVLNNSPKYVASTTLTQPLPWQNSTLIGGDVPAAVARLKKEDGQDLVVLGSGELLRSLIQHRLVDEFVLIIHPLVFGSGQRLFDDGGTCEKLRLMKATWTTTGVVIATYQILQ
jgi:dihydrofolate reductase